MRVNSAAAPLEDVQGIIDGLRVGAVSNPITGYVVSAAGSVSGAVMSSDSNGNLVATATTDITCFYYFPTTGVLAMGANYTIKPTGSAGLTMSTPASQHLRRQEARWLQPFR